MPIRAHSHRTQLSSAQLGDEEAADYCQSSRLSRDANRSQSAQSRTTEVGLNKPLEPQDYKVVPFAIEMMMTLTQMSPLLRASAPKKCAADQLRARARPIRARVAQFPVRSGSARIRSALSLSLSLQALDGTLADGRRPLDLQATNGLLWDVLGRNVSDVLARSSARKRVHPRRFRSERQTGRQCARPISAATK